MYIDLSRGLESVPILVSESDASNVDYVFEKSYTYVRSLGIHSSVSGEAVPPTVVGIKGGSVHSGGPSTIMDIVCACQAPKERRHYAEDGLLHSRYITQVFQV